MGSKKGNFILHSSLKVRIAGIMKIVYFIITGIVVGFCFALVDNIIGNAEVSPVNPGASDLLKNVSISKFLMYSIIGAVTGIVFFGIFERIRKHK